MKRALVIGSGGLRGAYDAGVLALLGRELGPNYFDTIYASSVGVFAGTFYASGQPDTIESTWRNLVVGNQLVNYFNIFRGKNILDIEYLLEIFSDNRSYLDVGRAVNPNTRLVYVLSKYPSGEIVHKIPTKDNMLELLRAATVMPFFHKPVEVDGEKYIDIGGLVEPLPIRGALLEDFDEIIVVFNKTKDFYSGLKAKLFSLLLKAILPSKYHVPSFSLEKIHKDIEDKISGDSRIKVIRPKVKLPVRSLIDTDKERINKTIDIGIQDGASYIKLLSRDS